MFKFFQPAISKFELTDFFKINYFVETIFLASLYELQRRELTRDKSIREKYSLYSKASKTKFNLGTLTQDRLRLTPNLRQTYAILWRKFINQLIRQSFRNNNIFI